jgi:hypothetical protein
MHKILLALSAVGLLFASQAHAKPSGHESPSHHLKGPAHKGHSHKGFKKKYVAKNHKVHLPKAKYKVKSKYVSVLPKPKYVVKGYKKLPAGKKYLVTKKAAKLSLSYKHFRYRHWLKGYRTWVYWSPLYKVWYYSSSDCGCFRPMTEIVTCPPAEGEPKCDGACPPALSDSVEEADLPQAPPDRPGQQMPEGPEDE